MPGPHPFTQVGSLSSRAQFSNALFRLVGAVCRTSGMANATSCVMLWIPSSCVARSWLCCCACLPCGYSWAHQLACGLHSSACEAPWGMDIVLCIMPSGDKLPVTDICKTCRCAGWWSASSFWSMAALCCRAPTCAGGGAGSCEPLCRTSHLSLHNFVSETALCPSMLSPVREQPLSNVAVL